MAGAWRPQGVGGAGEKGGSGMTPTGWWLMVTGLSAVVTTLDVGRHPDHMMPIMNAVWPLMAVYFGPVGLGLYWVLSGRSRIGRVTSAPHLPAGAGPATRHPPSPATTAPTSAGGPHTGSTHRTGMAGMQDPLWIRSLRSSTHCMAGCALGDLVAMGLVGGLGLRALTGMVASEIATGAVLAFLFGLFVFQALPVMVERRIGFAASLALALRADTLTITAYLAGQIPVYLLLRPAVMGGGGFAAMQVSMAAGFMTTYPMNWWLVARGIKGGM